MARRPRAVAAGGRSGRLERLARAIRLACYALAALLLGAALYMLTVPGGWIMAAPLAAAGLLTLIEVRRAVRA